MLAPPVMVTVFRLAGTQLAFAPEFEAPEYISEVGVGVIVLLGSGKGQGDFG